MKWVSLNFWVFQFVLKPHFRLPECFQKRLVLPLVSCVSTQFAMPLHNSNASPSIFTFLLFSPSLVSQSRPTSATLRLLFFPSVCSLTSRRLSFSECCVSKPENLLLASCQANKSWSPDAAPHNWFACLWDESKWEIQPESCHGAAGGVNAEGCSVGWNCVCCFLVFFHLKPASGFYLWSFLVLYARVWIS